MKCGSEECGAEVTRLVRLAEPDDEPSEYEVCDSCAWLLADCYPQRYLDSNPWPQ